MIVSPDLDLLISGLSARKRGAEWMAKCPCHEDSKPSLSFGEKNGTVVVRCHAGCDQKHVIATLRERGLWPELGSVQSNPANGKAKVTNYEYRAATGDLLATHTRTDLANGKKSMAWLGPDGKTSNGQVKMSDLPLYRVGEIQQAPLDAWVIVTEGEKACEAARRMGFIATTLAGGAAQTDFGSALNSLQGRLVALWPDNDTAGMALMTRVQTALRGKAARVCLLRVEGLPEKGDAHDFVAMGRGKAEVASLIATAEAALLPRTITAAALMEREFTPAKSIVRGLLYEGAMLLAGRPKLGKSWCGLGIAVAIAYGGAALGKIAVESGDVLYLGLEDGERRLQTRLLGLFGDAEPPTRMTIATSWPRLDEGGLEALDIWLVGHPEARLVVIDTLKRIRPKANEKGNPYDMDYDSVAPLNDLGHQRGVAILIVHHTRKADAEDPLDLISGTLGLTGAVDGALVMKRARGDIQATLSVTCRDAEDCELALQWDGITGGWILVGDAAAFKRSGERQAVIDCLTKMPGQYPRDLADLLEKSQGATRKLLYGMISDGEVRTLNGRYYVQQATNSRAREIAVTAVTVPTSTSGKDRYSVGDGVGNGGNGLRGNGNVGVTTVTAVTTNTDITTVTPLSLSRESNEREIRESRGIWREL